MARTTVRCIANAATVKRSGEERLLVTLSSLVPLPLSNPDHLEALVKGNSTGGTALKIFYICKHDYLAQSDAVIFLKQTSTISPPEKAPFAFLFNPAPNLHLPHLPSLTLPPSLLIPFSPPRYCVFCIFTNPRFILTPEHILLRLAEGLGIPIRTQIYERCLVAGLAAAKWVKFHTMSLFCALLRLSVT